MAASVPEMLALMGILLSRQWAKRLDDPLSAGSTNRALNLKLKEVNRIHTGPVSVPQHTVHLHHDAFVSD